MLDFTVTTDAEGSLHLGPRVIPIPTSISENARKFLATPFPASAQPDLDDKAAWHRAVEQADAMFEPVVDQWLATVPAKVETRTIGLPTPEDREMSDFFVAFVDRHLG